MHIELMLRDKTRVHVDVADAQALEAEVDDLLNRRSKYASGWVLVDNEHALRRVQRDPAGRSSAE